MNKAKYLLFIMFVAMMTTLGSQLSYSGPGEYHFNIIPNPFCPSGQEGWCQYEGSDCPPGPGSTGCIIR